MKIKKIITVLIFIVMCLVRSGGLHASEKINLYFFWGQGCPHCEKEREFLTDLSKNDSAIKLNEYEVWYNQANREVLKNIADKLQVEVNGVPFLAIGDKYVVGYLNENTTGTEIQNLINKCKTNVCPDLLSAEGSNGEPGDAPKGNDNNTSPNPPVYPKIANMDLSKFSLPVLTIVLGFLDGFNPCAMWVLLFLISLLIGMNDRKKMWILGVVFIVSSALVYFLFMVAWLKLFLFIGFIHRVRLFIGLISIAAGIAGLRKYLSKDSSGCDVIGEEKRKNVFIKLGKITSNKSFALSLIGIAGLAFAVNLVELVCSAGLPAVYTQILALSHLEKFQYYLYVLLYILFFMLDDLFVFVVAMITLQMTGITTKYVKYSRLLGGILMLIIGLLLILRPEVLMFS